MERRREQGSESPPSRQPHLAHLLVSPALPGHSSQPLSNRRARERTRGDGRCLEDWNGHGTASRAPPPPTCLTAASGHAAAGVSVRFLFASSACECVRFCAFAHQCRLLSVLCVGGKKESAYCLTVNAAGGTEMRCWGSVREEERGACGNRGGTMAKETIWKVLLLRLLISINQRCMAVLMTQLNLHVCVRARVCVCMRRATKGKKTKDKYIYMKLGGYLFVFCVAFVCF